MKPRFLLSNRFKTVGWILFVPALLLAIGVVHLEFQIDGLEIRAGHSFFVQDRVLNNLTDELAFTLVLISSFFIAFSREKKEDEMVSQIRLESLQWSVYVNYFLLLLATWLVYDDAFFTVMIYNMFTILFFFILRFNMVLYVLPALRGGGHEK